MSDESLYRIDIFGPAWHRESQSWRIYAHKHGPGPCRQIEYLWSGPYESLAQAAKASMDNSFTLTKRPA